MPKLNHRYATLALFGALPFVACSTEDKKAGLVIAVQTDMSVPKDVDAVEIEVSTYGNVMFSNKYDVGEGGLSIPATLTLLPPDDASTPVTIRVISYQGGKTRTLRRVVTTVPDSREALLRMPIQWLCDGEVKLDKNDANPTSSCKTGSSCLAGSCAPDEVDSKDLPAFTKAGVFGAKNADGDIQCFSTVACLASNKVVPASELDLEDCTITLSALEELTGPTGSNGTGELPGAGGSRSDSAGDIEVTPPEDLPDDADPLSKKPGRGTLAEGDIDGGAETPSDELTSPLNFAFSFPPGSDVGICGEGEEEEPFGCFVPLDFDATAGWRVEGDVVHLPPAVCKKLSADDTLTLVTSKSCPAKSANTPPCGPWLQNYEGYSQITVQLPSAPDGGSGGTTTSAGGTVQSAGGSVQSAGGTVGTAGSGGSVIGGGSGGLVSGGGGGGNPELPYDAFEIVADGGGLVSNDVPIFVGDFVATSDETSSATPTFGGGFLCVDGTLGSSVDAYGGLMFNVTDIDSDMRGFSMSPSGSSIPAFTRVTLQQDGIIYCQEAPSGDVQNFLFENFLELEADGCTGAPFGSTDPSSITSIQFLFSNKVPSSSSMSVCLSDFFGLYQPPIGF